MTWARTTVANRISTTAVEWTNNFARANSGTYNNGEWSHGGDDIYLRHARACRITGVWLRSHHRHSHLLPAEWMVLDFAHWTPGSAFPAGFFMVLEQMPGYITTEDKTPTLQGAGFWPSYNVCVLHWAG